MKVKVCTYVVYFDNFLDEFRYDRLVGYLKCVDQLDTAVDVLDVFAFDAGAARHVKPGAFVRAATSSVSVLSDCVHSHARLQALGEPTRRTPFAVERSDVALAFGRVARKHLLVLHGPLEEALAGLARERAVVETADLVAADGTRAHR